MLQLPQFFLQTDKLWLVILLAAWSLPWKGVALWKASCKHDKRWFIALLVVNTIGLLEILYIFYFSKRVEKAHSLIQPTTPQP